MIRVSVAITVDGREVFRHMFAAGVPRAGDQVEVIGGWLVDVEYVQWELDDGCLYPTLRLGSHTDTNGEGLLAELRKDGWE